MVGSQGRKPRKTAQKSLGRQKVSRTGLKRALSSKAKKTRTGQRQRSSVRQKVGTKR